MQFAILVYETEADFATREDIERKTAYRAAHLDYLKALKRAGIAIRSVVGGPGLSSPDTATTVRTRGGVRHLADGGGIYLIDVSNLDAALIWAERCPAASTGAVEVRPVQP